MVTLTKILKTSGTSNEILKNEAITPSLRYFETQHIKSLRLLENGGKRLLEGSLSEVISILKTSATLSKISK